jgi:hypothetical protein
MNSVDNIKIISPTACENIMPFRHTLLLSEITPRYTDRATWLQSESLFSSRDNLMQVKIRQMHCTPYPL